MNFALHPASNISATFRTGGIQSVDQYVDCEEGTSKGGTFILPMENNVLDGASNLAFDLLFKMSFTWDLQRA